MAIHNNLYYQSKIIKKKHNIELAAENGASFEQGCSGNR